MGSLSRGPGRSGDYREDYRMTWARQSERGDPAKVLERRQEPPPARTCAGCKEIRVISNPFGGRRVLRCALGEEIGQRCSKYEERTAT